MTQQPKLLKSTQFPVSQNTSRPRFSVAAGLLLSASALFLYSATQLTPMARPASQDNDIKSNTVISEQHKPPKIKPSKLGTKPPIFVKVKEPESKISKMAEKVWDLVGPSKAYGQDLNGIPLSDIKRMEANSVVYKTLPTGGNTTWVNTKEKDGYEYFFQVITIPVQGEGSTVVGTASIGLFDGKRYDNEVRVSVKRNGKSNEYAISLDELSKSYKEITGNELKYVKLIAESTTVSGQGPFVGIGVVPTDKPDGEIIGGVPILIVVYSGGNVSSNENHLQIVASR